MNKKFSFNAIVLNIRIIYEVVAKSFKNNVGNFLIFDHVACIKILLA